MAGSALCRVPRHQSDHARARPGGAASPGGDARGAGRVRGHLWETALRIGLAQQAALGSRAQHLLVNDGRAASQTVPHVHIHVIPRYRGDTLHALARILWHVTTITVPRRETAQRRAGLERVAEAIRTQLPAQR